jgi:hypothetical protein
MTITFILASNSTLVDDDGLDPVYCEVKETGCRYEIVRCNSSGVGEGQKHDKRSLTYIHKCTNSMNIQGITIR